MTKEEEKIRNEAKRKMIEEIKEVSKFIREKCVKLDSDFFIYSCKDRATHIEIKNKFERIKEKYAEHNFDYNRYMPYIDMKSYKYIRLRSEMTFNKKDFLDKDKLGFFVDDTLEKAQKSKAILAEGFKNEADKNLFLNDLHGLQFYTEEVETKNESGEMVVRFTSGLLASNCNYIQRFHSGYHLLAYAREKDGSEQVKFRANCVLGDVEHCSKIHDREIMQRSDRKELTAIFAWEFPGRHKLKKIEFYPSDKIVEEANKQEEIEILI